jgi:hypothetical protein
MNDTQQSSTPPPANETTGSVKLPPFWPHAPALWFSQAECLFHTKRVTDQFSKYCNVVGSLPHESLRLVADIVESPPQETPYVAIKQRLLASHQLTSFQRAEKLFAMPPLGNRKPSDLMAAMLEICPRGEEKTDLFACLFLQRLPREIRILLADADHKDPKALADKADQLWGHHTIEGSGISAVHAEEEPIVAAVRSDNGGRGRGRGGRGGNRRGRGAGSSRAAIESDISRDARLAAGLCLRHWRYGDQAHGCEQPCSWPGNAAAGSN